jgi:hypothetical protein
MRRGIGRLYVILSHLDFRRENELAGMAKWQADGHSICGDIQKR